MAEIIDIIKRFENDMEFDAHGSATKLSRSDAARELIEMSGGVLPQIVSHLETYPPNNKPGVNECWGMVIHDILHRMGCYNRPETETFKKPKTFKDIQSWIDWAKKEVG